ncbi:MAG: SPOR domain-containing protein [Proteobacteria bacterium]|nr:SPOR domain-containing protein [Pseudomonadota bacterium]
MFYRLLFVLLVALNIGVAAWLLFGHAPAPSWPPATDPGVPELKLLSERAGDQPAAAKPQGPLPPANEAAADDHCQSLGPFPTQVDMRAAMQALTPHVPRIQFREEEAHQSRGFWVYLPALSSRDAALATARSLSARNVRDYYVVTAGDQQNTISLGLFHDRGNAERRKAEIAALGFNAQMNERVETLPVYWVDYVLPAKGGFDWRTWLPGRNDLQSGNVDCF